jgi:hypothetical protein
MRTSTVCARPYHPPNPRFFYPDPNSPWLVQQCLQQLLHLQSFPKPQQPLLMLHPQFHRACNSALSTSKPRLLGAVNATAHARAHSCRAPAVCGPVHTGTHASPAPLRLRLSLSSPLHPKPCHALRAPPCVWWLETQHNTMKPLPNHTPTD